MVIRSRLKSGKLQSAMEYLLTYGWALVIIAIVLGVLYSMGLFSRTTFMRQSCTAVPGYVCNYPELNGSGYLKVQFGVINRMTLTGVGCTSDSVPPSSLTAITPMTFVSGSVSNITFICPVSANIIGTPFSGYLWIGFNTVTLNNQEAMAAQITTPVATLDKINT